MKRAKPKYIVQREGKSTVYNSRTLFIDRRVCVLDKEVDFFLIVTENERSITLYALPIGTLLYVH